MSGTKIHILSSNSRRIPVLRWLIDAKDALYDPRKSNTAQVSLSCPPNYNFHEIRTTAEDMVGYEVSCQACAKGTFSFKAGQLNITGEITKVTTRIIPMRMNAMVEAKLTFLHTYNSSTYRVNCKPCPPGGECETRVRSRKNFYGYNASRKELEFIPCPSGYCCSNEKECYTIRSCRQNRTGRLCGKCIPGHQVSYATNDCFDSATCDSDRRIVFWITYVLTAVILASILSFARILKAMLKNMFVSLKEHFSKKRKASQHSAVELKSIENTLETVTSINNDAIVVEAPLKSSEPPEPLKTYSISAIFNILVSFYQIKSLVEVERDSSSPSKLSFIDDIMNLRFQMNQDLNRFCPFIDLDTITKEAIRGYGIPAVMITSLIAMWLMFRCFRVRDRFSSCVYVGFYIVLSFCFKDLSNVSLKLANCVNVDNVRVFYISGDVECSGHWWQYVNASLIGVWVLPFPVSVMLCYSLVRSKAISTRTFLMCLAFPIVAPVVFIYHLKYRKTTERTPLSNADSPRAGGNKKRAELTIRAELDKSATPLEEERTPTANQSTDKLPENEEAEQSVVEFNKYAKEHFQEIFEEPYKDHFWWWEMWRMSEKLIVSALAVFIYDVLTRIYVITVVLLVLTYFHYQLKPYKREMVILHRLDMVSFICLFFQLSVSLIRAFVIVYGSPVKNTFDFHLESVFTPLWYLPLFLIVNAVKQKVKTS